MGYYQAIWEDRKEFLIKSVVIGGALSLIANVLIVASGMYRGGKAIDIFLAFLLMFLLLAIVFSSTVSIIRMMGDEADGFAVGFLCGFKTTIRNTFFGFGIGTVIGIVKILLFAALFAITIAFYCVYLPVSTIYYFVRSRIERAGNDRQLNNP